MLIVLLPTSNTTACAAAPCLGIDATLEEKEDVVDHWPGPLKSSVVPILKKHPFMARCQGGKVAAYTAKRHSTNAYLYKLKWIIPKLRGV